MAKKKNKDKKYKIVKKRGPYKKRAERFILGEGFTPDSFQRALAEFELGPLPEVIGIVPTPSEEEAARNMREKTENAWKQVEHNILNDSEFGAAARLVKNAIDDEVEKRIAFRLRQETASLNETLFRVRDELKAESLFVENIQQKLSCGTRFDILNEIARLQSTNMQITNIDPAPSVVIEDHPYPADDDSVYTDEPFLDGYAKTLMPDAEENTTEPPWWKFWA